MELTLTNLYEMIEAADKAAKTKMVEAYAAFPENFKDVKIGIEAMNVALHQEIANYVEAHKADDRLTVID